MKKSLFFLCSFLAYALFLQNATALAVSLELDRVFYFEDPSLPWIHGTAYANDGTLWVADAVHYQVFQYDPDQPDGGSTTPLSSFSFAPSAHVRDTAWNHDTDTLWIAFADGNVVNYNQSGTIVRSFNAGGQHLSGLAYENSELYLSLKYPSDGWQKYSVDGLLLGSFSFQGNVGSQWSGMAYDEDRDLLWVMHDGGSWQAYNPNSGTLLTELDWLVVDDLGWNIALAYGYGALWAGAVFGNMVGRIEVTPTIPDPGAGFLLFSAGLVGLLRAKKRFKE